MKERKKERKRGREMFFLLMTPKRERMNAYEQLKMDEIEENEN